jgi:F-type H+-transporting ATPase subunit b
MELFQALGLDLKILAAQLLNFAILFFVIYRFGFKPIMSFIEERKEKIDKGVKNAEKAKIELEEAIRESREIILGAKKEAMAIMGGAKQAGEDKRKEIVEKAKEEIGQIINQEKAKMQIEKAETLKAIKKEVAELAIAAAEKILKETIDDKKEKTIIKNTVKALNEQ